MPLIPAGQHAPSEYARNLEVSLRQALERENGLRAKLQRERSQFRTKLDEYEWLCRCVEGWGGIRRGREERRQAVAAVSGCG